ncbi:MAG: SIS domain-containing protein [bacterium]|nr:SIS domain-containing protein [bacterium]
MMRDAIVSFPQQFTFKPVIENSKRLKKKSAFVVAGMGGSNLATELVRSCVPSTDVIMHRSYDLPNLPKASLKDRLIIANSFSGNTEETLDTAAKAQKAGLALAVITSGGKLLAFAKKHKVSYILEPNTGLQPRMAIGFTIRSLFAFMGMKDALTQTERLATTLKPLILEEKGKQLARALKGTVPVIYTSFNYAGLGYNWKVKFNETGKVPAFCNTIPEMNHTEMTGFDVKSATRALSRGFTFLILQDSADHSRIVKRMRILERLYKERGLRVIVLAITGKTIFDKVFSSFSLADWTAFYTAAHYGSDPEQVPMVEEFKRLIA